MATLYAQLVDAADAVANNQHPGILASYLINAISHQHDMFLSICDRQNSPVGRSWLVISRPTTDQLIADVCQDLVDAVLPALTDETLQVRVAMAETVLRNAAVRAAMKSRG